TRRKKCYFDAPLLQPACSRPRSRSPGRLPQHRVVMFRGSPCTWEDITANSPWEKVWPGGDSKGPWEKVFSNGPWEKVFSNGPWEKVFPRWVSTAAAYLHDLAPRSAILRRFCGGP